MSYPGNQRRGRRAFPFIASLTLGLAALPALGAAPQAHAATARQVARGQGGQAEHAKPLGSQAKIAANYIIPSTVPSGATVVTNCTSAGLNLALQTYATISFNCAPGGGSHTIDLGASFEVVPGETLTIDGSDGGRNDIILTGNATGVEGATCGSPITGHPIFRVDFGSSLTLTNLTLTHGYSAIGGAVAALGTFTADRDIFSANGAHDAGGALDLSTDTPSRGQVSTITNSTFVDNYTTCGRGGAIDVDYAAESGLQQVTLRHDTFTNNGAFSGNGGAIAADNNNAASMLEITDAIFRGNAAYSPENNCAVAAYNLKKACAVNATAVERPLDGGIAGNGGAVDTYNQNMHIGRSLFDSNSANDGSDGGAVYIGHGGVQNAGTFVTTIDRTTFVNNYADNVGGAIYDEGLLRLSNDTITENVAGLAASAIYFFSDSGDTLTIAASTINANVSDTSVYDGAAIVNDRDGGNGTLAIGTSIVYDNTTLNEVKGSIVRSGAIRANQVAGGTAIECNGPIQDNGHNLSDYDLTPTTNSCGFTQIAPPAASPDILVPVGTDVGLGPLGAYGGPTLGAPGNTSPTFTERLLKGSPAIDAVPTTPTNACVDASGGTLAVDERGPGFVRPFVAACDIGAFEVSYLGSSTCSVAITFFSGGTAFALRTGSALNTLMSYLSIKGSGGQITAVPLVPRAGVPSTLSCTVPDPNAPVATPPASVVTVTVDAQVVYSTNTSVARLSTVRVVATRTATSETVTVSAINPDNSTGTTLYTLTPFVQPQSFVIRSGIPTLFQFP